VEAESREKPPTLKDVASLAKVDPSVVSRLINGDERLRTSEATRVRVLDAVKALGYRSNLTAKGLKTGKTFLIGLLVPDFANPVYADIIRGAQEAAEAVDYSLILGSVSGPTHGGDWLNRLLDAGRVDGVLFASAVLEDPRMAEIARSDRRILVLNRLIPGVQSAVVVDDAAGSRLAAAHLLGLGHKHLAVVAGPRGVETTSRRLDGFRHEVIRAGLDEPMVRYAEAVSVDAGYAATQRLLAELSGFTAIFASTLTIGAGALEALRERGRTVPEDMSVIALNDGDLARHVTPALTTVAMPNRAMGRIAVEQLLDRIDGEVEDRQVVVNDPPPRLVARASTGPAGTAHA
jgi:LacI family transcriptional regulator